MSEIKPITREESFLAKLGGQDVTTPTPITRAEQFLQAIIDNGGGGGGGGGGVLVVGSTMNPSDMTLTLNKTWNDITSASFAIATAAQTATSTSFIFFTGTSHSSVSWGVYAVMFNSSGEIMPLTFSAESPDEPLVAYLN